MTPSSTCFVMERTIMQSDVNVADKGRRLPETITRRVLWRGVLACVCHCSAERSDRVEHRQTYVYDDHCS